MVYGNTEAAVDHDDSEKNGRKEVESVRFILSCPVMNRAGLERDTVQHFRVVRASNSSRLHGQDVCANVCVQICACVRVGKDRVGRRNEMKDRGEEYIDI